MISIEYCPERFSLKASGHAYYAPPGEDIVCAAASTLIQALAQCVHEYSDGLLGKPTIVIGEKTEISCRPKKERERDISLLYRFCICGLQLLALHYPQNIGITVLWHENAQNTDSQA